MICKFKKAVEEYNMFQSGDRVIVALSGGADSMTLLHMLHGVKDEYSITVTAAHVNHCLRGAEADRDMKFVKNVCEAMGIELKTLVVDVKAEAAKTSESIEECGRRIRYDFFKSIDSSAKVATAHTLSDNEETVLMNLARGTGLSGLIGIPPVRENIVRPLIYCTRDEIESYCQTNGIDFVNDSTNEEDDYTRNYIRHNIIPCFKKLNTSFDDAFSRCITVLKKDDSFLNKCKDYLIKKSTVKEGLYDTIVLVSADEAVRKRALIRMVHSFCGVYPEKIHIDLLDELLFSSGKVQITTGIFAFVKQKQLWFEKTYEKAPDFDVDVFSVGEYNLPEGTVIITQNTHNVYKDLLFNSIDCDKIGNRLVLRNRRTGDKITLQKRKVTKTLKKLFCEENIPESDRDKIPVLADENGVIWVCGFGTDAKYVPDSESENVFTISFVKEN